jgi:CHU_C Type IX secretion signal domain
MTINWILSDRSTIFPKLLLTTVLIISSITAIAQPEVDGSRAVYARIDSFIARVNTDVDSVFVNDVTGFAAGDTVLFYMSKGIESVPIGFASEGGIQSVNNTGKYAFFKIAEVVSASKCVVLNNTLPGLIDFASNEVGQLIKVPTYNKARLTSSFSFPAWDPVSFTGGVFPIIVGRKLSLEADLSANAKGLKGGVPSDQYTGDCSSTDIEYQEKFFLETVVDRAGKKGESVVTTDFAYTRGLGYIINGGGGGNGKFSGGGGGSNKGQGGQGGDESTSCGAYDALGGQGGLTLTSYYTNTVGFSQNRIFFGGGGGASTQDPTGGLLATPGGNGGGVLIILTDTLEGNGHNITANGGSVAGLAGAGAGGGGGGGVIVLDVFTYTGNVNLEVKGGNGGDVAGVPAVTGPGGGGGGGVIWHNNTSLPGANVILSISGGISGTVNGSGFHNATNGVSGLRLGNILTPIRGFLINTMPDDQTICEEMTPNRINASLPKGGNGSYTYSWLQSTDMTNWSTAVNTNNERTYQPPQLFDTTYYKRAISDGQIKDTSFIITINVHPKLQQNLIADDDTVCYNLSPGTLTAGSAMIGGLGPDPAKYNYRWIKSNDNLNFTNAVGTNTEFNYDVPKLTDTTYFHRIVSSGACTDTSNLVSIKVLPSIVGNTIASDQIICNNQTPAQLTGNPTTGGLNSDKRYQWQQQIGTGNWTDLSTTANYSPSSLTSETYNYQRIVFSGAEDVCVDTSNQIQIEVLPDIIKNNILDGDTIICAQLPTITIDGTQAEGGDGVYKYYWQSRLDAATSWSSFPEINVNDPLQPGVLNSTNWFRRVIFSGAGNVCSSSSDSIRVQVLPVISNNTISAAQTICENTTPVPLNGFIPTGGDGSYIYQWQKDIVGDDSWTNISTNGDIKDFSPGVLIDTIRYRRNVLSGLNNTCQSTSNELTINVQPAIANNLLEVSDYTVCVGSQPVPVNASDNPTGGNGTNVFVWQESFDNLSWSSASGAGNVADYQPGSLNVPMYYRRIVNSGTCFDTTISVGIDTLSLPLLSSLSGGPLNICDDLDYYLKLNIIHGSKPYNFEYSNGVDAGQINASIAEDTDSAKVNIEDRGIETFTYTLNALSDANGCEAPAANLLGKEVTLNVFRAPKPKIIKPSTPFRVCGPQLSLDANPDLEVPGGTWTSDNSDLLIDDPGEYNINLTYQLAAFDSIGVKVYFSQTTPSCGSRSDSLEIQLFEQPDEPFIAEGDSLIIFIIDTYELNGSAPTSGNAFWSVSSNNADILDPGNNPAIISSIPVGEDVTARYTVRNGVCPSPFDEILIFRNDVHVYEGISPNKEDGLNDKLIAEGLDDEATHFTFQLFSTNGMLVREIVDTDIDKLGFERGFENSGLVLWDGKTKNSDNIVPSGTYYYVLVIDYKGREFIDKGYIVVK